MYASVEPARQPYDKVEIGHVVGADDVPGSIPISGLSGLPVVLGHTRLELNIRGHVSITTIGNHVHMVLLLAASKDSPTVVDQKAHLARKFATYVVFDSYNAIQLFAQDLQNLQS